MSQDYHFQRVAGWHYFKLPVRYNKDGSPGINGIFTHAKVPVSEDGYYLSLESHAGLFRELTSPYGTLAYAIGSGDDFHCFDHAPLFGLAVSELDDEQSTFVAPLNLMVLHSVVNSETGGFIQGDCYEVVPFNEAVSAAERMTDRAVEWLYEGGAKMIRHTMRGWNQDCTYWERQVAADVGWEDMNGRNVLGRRILSPKQRLGWKRLVNQIPSMLSPAIRDTGMGNGLAEHALEEEYDRSRP